MIRLHLTAEGQTEETFAREFLAPFLAERRVYLLGIRLTALRKKKGYVHRGGMNHYLPVKNDICRWLKEDRAPEAQFTTMLDLYGLPRDFPGYDSAGEFSDPYQRVAALERAFADDLGDPRFIPYIQLHEFEALLFSDPRALACYFDGCDREIRSLVELGNTFDNPELIDDGQHSAPSIRIGKEIPEYVRAKATAGPIIAAEIGLEKIREKCRHFNDWLTKLESLSAA
jgi:hypothetical protein